MDPLCSSCFTHYCCRWLPWILYKSSLSTWRFAEEILRWLRTLHSVGNRMRLCGESWCVSWAEPRRSSFPWKVVWRGGGRCSPWRSLLEWGSWAGFRSFYFKTWRGERVAIGKCSSSKCEWEGITPKYPANPSGNNLHDVIPWSPFFLLGLGWMETIGGVQSCLSL